jgi:hypothetical protein
MATRMQQRRGTAAQWISTNSGNGPILNAGEIGYETDTNKFKIGDGTNHWINLDYFIDANSTVNPAFGSSITFEGATANEYETTLAVTDPTADRTITLPNVTGTVITTGNLSDITDIGVFTSTIVMEGSTANAFELTLSAGDPTADRTLTFPDATGTVATQEYVDASTTNAVVDQSELAGSGLTWNALTDQFDVNTTTIQVRVADVSDTEIGYLNGVSSSIQTQFGNKQDKVTDVSDTEIGYLNGVTSAIQTQIDNKLTSSTAATTYAPLANPTFTGTVSLPNNTISQSMMSDDSVGTNEIGGLAVTTAKINDLAVTEGKIADGAVTSTKIANDTIVDADINSAAAIAQSKISGLTTDLGLKAPLAGPALTGDATAVNLTISGNLTVNGTTTNINSTNLVVEDKNIVIGDTETPSDATADGGGITLKGATDKTFNWVDATDAWTSSEHINLASGKAIYLNGTLETAAAQTLTNKTIDGASNTLTVRLANDISGLGSGIATFLGTPSSANLISAITDETGTGSLVFGTSPTIGTPTLTLSATTSTASGRIAFDATNDKIVVGDGTIAVEFAPSTKLTNSQSASYTTVLADKDKIVEMNVGSANNLTVPPNSSVAYPVGSIINIVQTNSGQTTVVAGAGVTVNATPGLKLRAQWSSASLIKRAENTWVLVGDLVA